MKENKTASKISSLSAWLVLVLAGIAFTLSYSALRDVAQTHGVGPWLSYLWPLLIDFALIVFSLAVLRANLRAESAWWPWTLVGFFTLTTIGFNFIHAQADSVSRAVAIAAPVALFFSFETLMAMVRAEVKRGAAVQSLAEIEAERNRQRAEAEAEQAEAVTALGYLGAQIAEMTGKAESLRAELAVLRKEKRQGYTGISVETKEAALAKLAERPDLSGAQLGRELGKSDSLGRKLRRELLPVVNGAGNQNGNGNH